MCPLVENDFENWKKTKQFPAQKLSNWFALNPYELRNNALSKELTLEERTEMEYQKRKKGNAEELQNRMLIIYGRD